MPATGIESIQPNRQALRPVAAQALQPNDHATELTKETPP